MEKSGTIATVAARRIRLHPDLLRWAAQLLPHSCLSVETNECGSVGETHQGSEVWLGADC